MTESCKMETKCGMVEKEECDEILELHLRKNALTELFLSLPKLEQSQFDRLYNKLVIDMGKTVTTFQEWWDKKAKKYQWQAVEGGHWRIDFETCEIYLVAGV